MNEFELANECAAAMKKADKSSPALGISVEIIAIGEAEATLEVTADMLNGFNVCHGGLIFALADTAFAYACNSYNKVTYSSGASIDFLLPARAGDRLLARATERRRGGRTGVYDVSVSNQNGDEIAVFRGRSVATNDLILISRNEMEAPAGL